MHPLAQFKFCPKCGSSRFVENNFKSKRCEDCEFIYYFNSSSSTVALIVHDKKLLVGVRAFEPAKGTLDLPGGFVDMGETFEQAMTREVKEETNLDVIKLKYLFSVPNLYVYSGFQIETTDAFFLCTVKNIDSLQAEDDVSKLDFIELDKLDISKFGLVSVRAGLEKALKEGLLK